MAPLFLTLTSFCNLSSPNVSHLLADNRQTTENFAKGDSKMSIFAKISTVVRIGDEEESHNRLELLSRRPSYRWGDVSVGTMMTKDAMTGCVWSPCWNIHACAFAHVVIAHRKVRSEFPKSTRRSRRPAGWRRPLIRAAPDSTVIARTGKISSTKKKKKK